MIISRRWASLWVALVLTLDSTVFTVATTASDLSLANLDVGSSSVNAGASFSCGRWGVIFFTLDKPFWITHTSYPKRLHSTT
jgi:hypothetical protein